MSSLKLHMLRLATVIAFCAPLAGTAQQRQHVLTQHVPAIVKSGRASRLAPMAASEQLQLTLSLPLQNQDALNALLADLYNPASPRYHQWLTPAQFEAKFGAPAADFTAMVSWARSHGLEVVTKSGNHRILTVQGSVSAINYAFNVQLTTYHDNNRNRDFHAPDREPTLDLPVTLLGISGLDTSNPRVNFHRQQPNEASAASREDSTISNGLRAAGDPVSETSIRPAATGSGPSGTFLPSDMRAAYYGSGPLTGAGQNVAIFSYDGYLSNDVPLWYTDVGLTPSTVPITNVLTGGFDGNCELDNPCDDGEQVLDILQVQGMAPGLSHIYFYEGLSAVTELNQMASDNQAAVITSSWGGGDFGPAIEPSLLQMAAQGQTFLNATGDDGAFNGWTYIPPSSDPYIVQVGGTDLTTASAGGAWSAETGWSDSGGGFFDPGIAIPSWQTTSGVINATNAGSTTMRNAPDIAAEANFDNSQVSNGAFSTGWGGTSYATPRLAGYLALANQQSVANGTGRLGFINPTLYDLGLRSDAASIYHDITSGKNTASTNYNGSKIAFNATTGYDLVTGWGSPNGTGLLNALTGPNFSLALDATALTVARSNAGTVHITTNPINNFSGAVSLSTSTLPTGVTAAITATGTNSYSLVFSVNSTASIGTSTITVTGSAVNFTHTATVALTVGKRTAYDFAISATSVSTPQNGNVTSVVTVQEGSGYDGPVDLSVGTLPAGVTAVLGTPSTFSKSNLEFIVGVNSAPGTYPIVVTGSAAGVVTHSTNITLTITSMPSVLLDGGFEQSSGTLPWSFTSSLNGGYQCNADCGYFPHGNSNFAYLNGWGATDTDSLKQTFTIPMGNTATLSFWLLIATAETSTTAKNDTFTVTVTPSGGTATTIATFSNLDHSNAYVFHSYDLSAYLNQTVTITFTGVENNGRATAFLLDDIAVVPQ